MRNRIENYKDVKKTFRELARDDLKLLINTVILFFAIFIPLGDVFLASQFNASVLWIDSITLVIFLGIRLLFHRYPKWTAHSNLFVTMCCILLLADVLVTFSILKDPFYNLYPPMIIIGLSFFLLSLRWWTIATVVIFAAWYPIAHALTPTSELINYLFAMIAATMLSGAVVWTRIRTYLRMENLRIRDSKRKTQLETALRAAKKEITVRKRAEDEKRSLEEQLRQTQKMEAIGRLAGGIAHDMNNILGAILGSATMIDQEVPRQHALREDIDNILTACRRGRDLTRDLLGFARKGKYVSEPVSLNDVVEKVGALLNRTFPKKVITELGLANGLRYVEGDPNQIEHALMNVCINAADAMNGEGVLTITTKNIDLKERLETTVMGLTPGRYVELRIQDTGIGMTKEIQKKAFEPFFTTKPKGKGTGLGLSMVYGAIKNHGGVVLVESTPGQGTIITFLLPTMPEGQIKPVRPRFRRQVVKHKGSGTVLLVDDEDIIRKSSSRLLQKLGYDVMLAENGKEAIEIYSHHRQKISLILLDQLMPIMDGTETFESLKKIDPDVKVLICSGYSKTKKIEALLANGAVGFVEKPFEISTLASELNAAMKLN